MSNINFNGGNFSGVQVGDQNSQTNSQTIESTEQTKRFFTVLTDCVPPEVAKDVLEPLQTLAALPPEELATPAVMSRASVLCERLTPYAKAIAKGLGVFGAAALSSWASSNPVIAGVTALCKVASDQ